MKAYDEEWKKKAVETTNNAKELAVAFATMPLKERVAKARELVDEAVEGQLKPGFPDITCKKGCAFCCYQRVTGSRAEAQEILEYCKENGIQFSRARIKKQARAGSLEEWLKLPYETKRCAFLGENNECKIYPIRPLACRSYFSISDPQICDTRNDNTMPTPTCNQVDVVSAALYLSDFMEVRVHPLGLEVELVREKIPRGGQDMAQRLWEIIRSER